MKEKRSRDKHLSVSSKSSDEESGVELEGPSNVTKKRSSSWRLAAMFTKSQNNPKPDKGIVKYYDVFMTFDMVNFVNLVNAMLMLI